MHLTTFVFADRKTDAINQLVTILIIFLFIQFNTITICMCRWLRDDSFSCLSLKSAIQHQIVMMRTMANGSSLWQEMRANTFLSFHLNHHYKCLINECLPLIAIIIQRGSIFDVITIIIIDDKERLIVQFFLHFEGEQKKVSHFFHHRLFMRVKKESLFFCVGFSCGKVNEKVKKKVT